uniref:Putative terminase n=1 Tax=viral metagenome TaxID=1070528 RepID=A0A6M3INW3_9ZZZZ
MKTHLTQKQETFCLKYFELGNASEAARLALYSPKTAATIGAENLLKPKIQTRLQELQRKVEDESVATVLERKQRLTEILRAEIPDYVSEDGIKVEKSSPNVGAVSEVTTKTKVFKRGGEPVIITNLKLHSPIQAINELNKMEKIHTDGISVNVNQVEAKIVHFDAGEVARAIIEAMRLGITPDLLGGDGHGEDATLLSSPSDIQATAVPRTED